ncbi:hypothetical protein QFZ99_006045 [Paraburkholderia atlantica]|uniref:hypothetical protein n=1 Tax=Paraburkholderia atlantica TaxID=2654982 RepID=UPI003D1B71A5
MDMDSLSIAEAWQEFDAHVIPLRASRAQHSDMRMAFYTGACAILEFTTAIAEIPDINQGVRLLDRLHAEKRAFLHEMELRNRKDKP